MKPASSQDHSKSPSKNPALNCNHHGLSAKSVQLLTYEESTSPKICPTNQNHPHHWYGQSHDWIRGQERCFFPNVCKMQNPRDKDHESSSISTKCSSGHPHRAPTKNQ